MLAAKSDSCRDMRPRTRTMYKIPRCTVELHCKAQFSECVSGSRKYPLKCAAAYIYRGSDVIDRRRVPLFETDIDRVFHVLKIQLEAGHADVLPDRRKLGESIIPKIRKSVISRLKRVRRALIDPVGTEGSRPRARRYMCSMRRYGHPCGEPIVKAEA